MASNHIRRRLAWLLIASLVGLMSGCDLGTGLSQVGIVPPTLPPDESVTTTREGHPATPPTPVPAPALANMAFDGDERRLIDLFLMSNPSVVHVHVEREESDASVQSFHQQMLRVHRFAGFRGWVSDPDGGSGFVLDQAGHILTTNRVIAGARDIQVTFANGNKAKARVIGADRNTDLAVLEVEQLPATARPLELGDSDRLQVGQRVMAIGNPLGHGGAMSAGVVSAKARNVSLEIRIENGFFTAPDLIQTDATILPGTVGGPLIDLTGTVVGVLGIDTLVFDAAGAVPAGGVAFSIPTSTVRRVVPTLLEEGRYPYPWLGISAVDMDPDLAQAMNLPYDQRGVLVARVTPNSPADKAGLRGSDRDASPLGPGVEVGGDVIVGFEGRRVSDFDQLVSLLFRLGSVGETVKLTIIRNGRSMEVPLILEERPQ